MKKTSPIIIFLAAIIFWGIIVGTVEHFFPRRPVFIPSAITGADVKTRRTCPLPVTGSNPETVPAPGKSWQVNGASGKIGRVEQLAACLAHNQEVEGSNPSPATISDDSPRWAALSQIESGNCDACTGPDGEVSRFQILPKIWIKYSHLPLFAAQNPFTALKVANLIMADREKALLRLQKRPVNDWEFYLLWHRPAVFFTPGTHFLSSENSDRMVRFENLTGYFRTQLQKRNSL